MWHMKGSILRLRPAFEVDETSPRDDASFSHASAPSRPLALRYSHKHLQIKLEIHL